ncbi:MAG: rod shape-determining protein MreD [FCB group bacterium]|nr:rod shape-determining protein MreD [FCB group bacterium]
MKNNQLILITLGVLALQFLIGPWLTIRGVRPDFFLILIVYIGVSNGSFFAVIVGFLCGLIIDGIGVGSYFGLSSLIYVLTGYLSGFLKGKYQRFIPATFTIIWIGIVLLSFFIYSFFRFQYLWDTDFLQFLNIWILTSFYTLSLMGILQFVRPLR